VSKEWLWCAVTRATDFNNVYFSKMIQPTKICLRNKVEGHKGQDRKGGREIVDEYIDEHV
jgi:hypothetical protein